MSKFYIKSISEMSIFTLNNELVSYQKYDPPIMLNNEEDICPTDNIFKDGKGGRKNIMNKLKKVRKDNNDEI